MISLTTNKGERDEMNEVNLSDAMTLLIHFWKCALRVRPFSDRRFSSTLHDALDVTIQGGLTFDKDDCAKFKDEFALGGGYFKEQFLSFNDEFYTKAIIAGNISACHSFEHCVGRKPFMANNVDHPYHWLKSMPGRWDITRPRDRLGLGSKFTWRGKKVTVTSFDDKNGKIIVCSYKLREHEAPCLTCGRGGWETGKLTVEHIYKLTNKDLRVNL